MYDLLEIIKVCRENDMKEYENKASYTNTDIGKVMIVYTSKTLHEKDVDNWGRKEDEDILSYLSTFLVYIQFLGLDETGWIKYTHSIQYGKGEAKILSENTTKVDDEYIYNYLTGDSCTNKEFLMFMKKACDSYRAYF